MPVVSFSKDLQYYKFCLYGFLKNQRFFELYFLIILHTEKGLSLTQFGILYSVRLVLRALLEIPSGFIADALGRKGSMLFSYSCYIASFTLYYFSENFIFLLIPTILFGIGDAFRTGTHKAMIFEYLKIKGWKDYKVDYYGHTRSWSQTGSAISSIIATAIIWFRPDYNIVFLYTLIPYSIGFFLLASYPGSLEGKEKKKFSSRDIRNEISAIIRSSLKAFRNSTNLRLTLNIASYTGYYFAIKDYLQLIILGLVMAIPLETLNDFSADKKEKILLGMAYSALFFLTALASRNTYKISRKFRTLEIYLNFLLVSGFIFGLVSGVLYQLNYVLWSLLLFILIYVIQNLQRPAGVSVISDKFDEKILASVLSIESQLGSIIGAGISIITGIIADQFGAGVAVITVSLLLLVVFPILKINQTTP